MSESVKRYAILTPFDRPDVVAGILALHGIDASVLMTESGALVIREVPVPVYDEWDIRNITGPDGTEDEDREDSDKPGHVASILSKLTKYGVVLIEVDLGTDVGIEAGVSGMAHARRYLAGEQAEEISAGALLNVIDPLIERLVLGYDTPAEHDAINSSEITPADILRANDSSSDA